MKAVWPCCHYFTSVLDLSLLSKAEAVYLLIHGEAAMEAYDQLLAEVCQFCCTGSVSELGNPLLPPGPGFHCSSACGGLRVPLPLNSLPVPPASLCQRGKVSQLVGCPSGVHHQPLPPCMLGAILPALPPVPPPPPCRPPAVSALQRGGQGCFMAMHKRMT